MMYCFRERELLLNINELIAGFRMFPSYLRIGGLREDLPPGSTRRSTRSSIGSRRSRRVRRPADQEPDLAEAHARRRRAHAADTMAYGLVGPIARASGVPYDVRKTFRTPATRPSTSTCPTGTAGDVYERYLVRMEEMRQSVRISKQAISRITPRGRLRHPGLPDRAAAEGQGLQRDGRADSALPHLLAGLHRPAGESYVPVEGPRGEHGFYIVSDGIEPALSRSSCARRASMPARGCRR